MMIKLSLMNYRLLFLLTVPVFSHSATFDMELLQNVALSQQSMQNTIINLGNPYHVGLSSDDSELSIPKESDNIVFHYEGNIRLSERGEAYKCRIEIHFDKCQANLVSIILFKMSETKVDPNEITAIWGEEKITVYKKFTDEGPESELVDSDAESADTEYWRFDKRGANVGIFKDYDNQVGVIEFSRKYLR